MLKSEFFMENAQIWIEKCANILGWLKMADFGSNS